MEPDIRQGRRKTWINHLEGLDTAIQVLIVDGVLIVPHAGVWSRHLITDEYDAVVSGIRLVLGHRGTCTCPSHDGRLHAYS